MKFRLKWIFGFRLNDLVDFSPKKDGFVDGYYPLAVNENPYRECISTSSSLQFVLARSRRGGWCGGGDVAIS